MVFKRLAYASMTASAVVFGLAAFMLNLATPPVNSDYAAYEKWLIGHQDQLLAEQSGRFFWTEMHSAVLFGGIATFLLLVALFSIQILIIAKVAKVTSMAVLFESGKGKTT
jgi:hypothetical protein